MWGVWNISATAFAWLDPARGQPTPGVVLRGYDPPEHKWLAGHRGVDLALPVGASVRAAGNGTVAFAGLVAGTPVISIDHADGIRTTYQPVHAQVRAGESVVEGQVIGTLARATTQHSPGLHWGARTGPETYINPLLLLDAPVIRLKPL